NCVMSCQQLWDREKILTLIKLYEQHSLLWNPREESYKMKYKRNDSLKVIATEIGADVEVVKKKIDSLLSQYRREKKIAESKSGMGSDEKKTQWWGLKHFTFLNDKFTRRPTYSSLQPQQEVIEDSYQQEGMIEDEEKVEEEDEISYTRSSSSRASATTDPGLPLHHPTLDAGEGTHSQPS
ncbi:hypothetical protein J6590_107749, partial [Homalodisca vitripennis]